MRRMRHSRPGTTPVLLLANVGILSDAEVALLRGYVEQGGNLLVTGLSGAYDRMGRLQRSPRWSR